MHVQRVTHVSVSPLGGAGAVAVRLRAGEERLGWRTELVSLFDTPFPRWTAGHPCVALAALVDYAVVRRTGTSAFFSLYRRQHAARVARRLADTAGVLHLHWLPGFLRPEALLALPLRAERLVWSVQDLWPLTGGCHYANGCAGFHTACRQCPQVHRVFQAGVVRAFRRKCEGFRLRRDLRIVVPSEWTRAQVEASAATRGLYTCVIPNPVDTSRFAPGDRALLRAKWGFAADTFVVGVGAADLHDERKQIRPTLAALRDWADSHPDRARIHVLVFGAGRPQQGLPESFHFVGPSPDAGVLAEWYNVMDVYVTLSRYETFGNTLAEAAACAVPSVCLTGSGTAEVVVDGHSGHHVAAIDQLPLALSRGLGDPARLRSMGAAARGLATRRFDLDVVTQKFIRIYEEDDPPRSPPDRATVEDVEAP